MVADESGARCIDLCARVVVAWGAMDGALADAAKVRAAVLVMARPG
jgi:hypothetical protein